MWLGRLLGTIFGYMLAKIPGAIAGFIVGNVFDQALAGQTRLNPQQQAQIQAVFFRITFLVMGHIAKADGRISEDEINMARNVMRRLQLSASQKQQAINYFNQGKQAKFNLAAALDELVQTCSKQRLLLRMFVEIQFQAALADGAIGPNKQRILTTICQRLGFTNAYAQFAGMYEHIFGSQQRQQYQRAYRPQQPSLNDDYKLMGLTSAASHSEIKRAYRRLMSQHHPDKLIAQGLPEEMVRLATDKTQQIQAAYEHIRKAKGF